MVDAELLYQAVPPEMVDDLRPEPGSAAETFVKKFGTADRRPFVMSRTRVRIER